VRERLLTPVELANRLGVCTETVLRWTRSGELPAYRLPGGDLRYRDSEFEAWLASRSTRADAADRGFSDARANRARRDGAYDAVQLPASDARPLDAATIEEDD
jgi:excisionase family DNA binding protein